MVLQEPLAATKDWAATAICILNIARERGLNSDL